MTMPPMTPLMTMSPMTMSPATGSRRPSRTAMAIAGFLVAAGLAGCGEDGDGDTGDGSGMSVTSSAIEEGGEIPATFACSPGDGESPPLGFGDVPAEATSLALIMRDETIRHTHWVVVDIPVTTTEVAAGADPEGGTVVVGYEPICPPSGDTHTYSWTLYALDGPAPDAGGNPASLAFSIPEAAIASGSLSGTYTGQ